MQPLRGIRSNMKRWTFWNIDKSVSISDTDDPDRQRNGIYLSFHF